MSATRPRSREEFWSHTDYDEEGCLLWNGPVSDLGYGVTRWLGVKRAHQVAYIISVGPLRPRQRVYRTCKKRLCVLPEHLTLTSQWPRPGSKPLMEGGTCRKGLHPWEPENIRVNRDGTRTCLACYVEGYKSYYIRRKKTSGAEGGGSR